VAGGVPPRPSSSSGGDVKEQQTAAPKPEPQAAPEHSSAG
jgi:hypothetical protein